MIVGNDIAGWQKDVDYPVYKNNTNFVIIKVSEGVGYTDPKFSRNVSEARAYKIPLGFYHFARPDLNNLPEAEAGWFLKAIGSLREGEVLCLDYEPKSNPFVVVDWCERFLKTVEAKTGVKAYIYLNKSQVRGFNWQPVADAGFPLWLASYDGDPISGVWNRVSLHQWTSSQKVPGILNGTGNVDGCWYYGTVEDFKRSGYRQVPQESPSISPSASVSPSESPSISPSPSMSESPSISPSPSMSPSPSPSPSNEIPEPDNCIEVLSRLIEVIRSPWWWVGKNAWYKKLSELKRILYEKNI